MNKYDQFYNNSEADIILTRGENILWQGKPNKKAFILNSVLPMLPIVLLWLMFDGFFIFIFAVSGAFAEVAFFLVPFFAFHLIPVWKWIGNILTSSKKWEQTKYVVTDRRIIIQSGFISSNINSLYYKDIENINLHIGVFDKIFGVGDIIISSGKYIRDASAVSNNLYVIADIPNPHETYRRIMKIVQDIQTDIEFPNALRPETNPGYNTKYQG